MKKARMCPETSSLSLGVFRAVTPIRSLVKKRRQTHSRSCTTFSPHVHRPPSHKGRRKARINHPSARVWASGAGVWRILWTFCPAQLLLLVANENPLLFTASLLVSSPAHFCWKSYQTDHGRTKCQHSGGFICSPFMCRAGVLGVFFHVFLVIPSLAFSSQWLLAKRTFLIAK